MGLVRDITTGKDGESYDIARVVMTLNALVLIPVLFLGIGFYLYGYIVTKLFDVQTFFTAVLTFEGSVAALLTSGAASILWKKSTEPDGGTSETLDITKGKQPDTTINNTVIK